MTFTGLLKRVADITVVLKFQCLALENVAISFTFLSSNIIVNKTLLTRIQHLFRMMIM